MGRISVKAGRQLAVKRSSNNLLWILLILNIGLSVSILLKMYGVI